MAKNSNPTNNGNASAATMTGPSLRVQRANRFACDTARFWHCTVVSILPQHAPDPSRTPRYKWTLEGPGTVRPWQLHFTTPQEIGDAIDDELDESVINEEDVSQEVESVEPQSLTLNALAKVCLKLGLVTESQLVPSELDQTLEHLDLKAAIGLSVVCQIAKRNTAFIDGRMQPCNPYYAPKMETLALDQ